MSFAADALFIKHVVLGVAASVAVFLRRWQKRRNEGLALGWPATEGCIHSGRVEPVPNSRKFLVTLQYSYFVGEYRAGTYTFEFQREHEADLLLRHMKNKRLQIRYKESDPDLSVLQDAVVKQHVLLTSRSNA